MKKFLILLCLLCVTSTAWSADRWSLLNRTVHGGYKDLVAYAGSDTIYTAVNFTAYFADADTIRIFSPANGNANYRGIIASRTAAYFILTTAWGGAINESAGYFEMESNMVTWNNPNGRTVAYVDPIGDYRMLDPLGVTVFFMDASTPNVTLGTIGLALNVGDGTNASTYIAIAGSRTIMGYDGANSYLQGGSGKGLYFSSNLMRRINITSTGLISTYTDTLAVLPSVQSTVSDSSTFITRNARGNPRIGMTDSAGNLTIVTASGDTLYFEGASKYIFDAVVKAPGFDPPHLFVGFGDSTRVIDCTQDAWAQITNAGDNLFAVNDTTRITYAVGDTLVVQATGDYKMDAVVSFQGNNGETWKVGFLKTGTLIDYAMRRYTSTNDTGNLSVTAYETLTAGDKVVLAIMNLTDGDDPTIVSATIWMTRYE